jgi:hypothetical protein
VLRLRKGAVTIAGRVVDGTGAAVAGARVLVGDERRSMHGSPDGRLEMIPPPVLATTGPDGAFRAEGLSPGAHPVAVRARGFAPSVVRVRAEEGESTVEVRLGRSASVSGRVTDGRGAPVPRAFVGSGEYGGFGSSMTWARPDGSYVLEDLASGGGIEVRASNDDGSRKASTLIVVEAGATSRWDPVLGAGRTIRGRVTKPDGTPAVGWRVEGSQPVPTKPYQVQATTGADGGFELTNCSDEEHEVRVYLPWQSTPTSEVFSVARAVGVRADGDPLAFAVRESDLPGATLAGLVVDEDGSTIAGAKLSVANVGLGRGMYATPDRESGRFEAGPLPSGTYRLTLHVPGAPQTTLAEREVPAGVRLDLGRLVPPRPGTLVAEVVDAQGRAVAGTLSGTSGADNRGTPIVDGAVRAPWPPGTWVLTAWSSARATGNATAVVRSGEETRVRIVLGQPLPR